MKRFTQEFEADKVLELQYQIIAQKLAVIKMKKAIIRQQTLIG